MKCAVVVVLCAGLSASVFNTLGVEGTFRRRSGRQYQGAGGDTVHFAYDKVGDGYDDYHQGNSHEEYSHGGSAGVPVKYYDDGYQQHRSYQNPQDYNRNQYDSYPNQHDSYQNQHYAEQPNVLELNGNQHYSEPQKYQQENNYEHANVQYVPVPQEQYYQDVQKSVEVPYSAPPTYSTPVHYGAPLAPYPPQYNQHQLSSHQGLTNVQYQIPAQQQNFGGYSDLFDGIYAPAPGPVQPTKPLTTVKTTAAPPPPSPPNNIFSLLLSLSQSSSQSSQSKTTRRPAAATATTTTTKATAQPPPKAQVYTFVNLPPQFKPHPQALYGPQRREFNPFILT